MWYACFDFEKKRNRKAKVQYKWDEFDKEGGQLDEAQADYILKEGGGKEALLSSSQQTSEMESIAIDKDDYLENPALYSIGLKRECFSKTLFM